MKKLTKVLLLLVLVIFTAACGNNQIPKTEFFLNEEATIDKIVLVLKEAKYTESNQIEFVFSITNKTKNTITLDPDTNFKLYDVNQFQISNTYQNNINIIKKNETISYTLQYENLNKDTYGILFYSGVVENNIKFTANSSDIKK